MTHPEQLRRPSWIMRSTVGWWALASAALSLTLLIVPAVVFFTGGIDDQQLARMSNAGQAYGMLSAMLSVVTLGAVAASLIYQARQAQSYRIDALKQRQKDLLAYVIAEPAVFGPCIGGFEGLDTDEEVRQFFFTTLWLNLARAGYEMGSFSAEHVRVEFAHFMFESPVARTLWETRQLHAESAKMKWGKFLDIFDQEYAAAIRRARIEELNRSKYVQARARAAGNRGSLSADVEQD